MASEERRDFYVYRWTGPTGSYIGKGRGRRAYNHMQPSTSGCPRFHRAIGKYGRGVFRLEFLKTGLSEAEALRDEILCIYIHEPEYNLLSGGCGYPSAAVTPELRAKLSASKRGKTHSAETRARLSAALKGKTFSPETRAKMSAAARCRVLSAEARAKISAAHRGRKNSAEHNARIAAAKTGTHLSAETKAKLSALRKGKPRGKRAEQ